jgi:membrane dipeptidase
MEVNFETGITKEQQDEFYKHYGSYIQTDIPRIKQGKLGGQFWSVYVSCDNKNPVETTIQQIGYLNSLIRKYNNYFQLVTNSKDIETSFENNLFPSLIGFFFFNIFFFIGIEGLHQINSNLQSLYAFYQTGVRYITLS